MGLDRAAIFVDVLRLRKVGVESARLLGYSSSINAEFVHGFSC